MPTANSLTYQIPNVRELHLSYMPFVDGGGVFIPTGLIFSLGDIIQVTLTVIEEKNTFTFSGKVVWITPEGAQNRTVVGVGVQLCGPEGGAVRSLIENILQDIDSDESTYTF